MKKVTAATAAPMSAMRSPDRPAWRPVKIDVAAPTANSAITDTIAAAMVAAVPLPTRNGTNGMTAPSANARNEEIAATHGEPSFVGIETELLARERVERDVGSAHDAVDE